MSVEKGFQELLNNDMQNLNTKVIEMLAQLDKNIALKTEIESPEFLAFYKTCAIYLKKRGLKDSSETLNSMIKYYLIYMVSKKRKGRLEIIEALKAMRQTINTNMSKLLGKNES